MAMVYYMYMAVFLALLISKRW